METEHFDFKKKWILTCSIWQVSSPHDLINQKVVVQLHLEKKILAEKFHFYQQSCLVQHHGGIL